MRSTLILLWTKWREKSQFFFCSSAGEKASFLKRVLLREAKSDTLWFSYSCALLCLQSGAVKLVLWLHWMHLTYMFPLTSENQFHCTKLYISHYATISVNVMLSRAETSAVFFPYRVSQFFIEWVIELSSISQWPQGQVSRTKKLIRYVGLLGRSQPDSRPLRGGSASSGGRPDRLGQLRAATPISQL